MAFVARIRSEFHKDIEKVEEVNSGLYSEEDSENGKEIREAYHQLYEKNLKIKKVNKVVFWKVNAF